MTEIHRSLYNSIMKKKEVTNEDLARLIAKGFEQTASKADFVYLKEDVTYLKEDVTHLKEDVTHLKEDVTHLKEGVADLKVNVNHIDARLGRMELDVQEIKGGMVYRHEFEDLVARVKYMESKLGIKA